jgi:hypothetical protein
VGYAGLWNLAPEPAMTAAYLETTGKAISAFREQRRRLPSTLGELRELPDAEVAEDGAVYDGWDRPLVYVVEGDRYTLTSLGRDGRPGGVGLDSDLSDVAPCPPESFPTLAQFLSTDMRSADMVVACLACGALAVLASLITLRAPDLHRGSLLVLVLKLALVTGASLVLASLLTMLEVPSGH